jgi:hypothetical protein
MLLSLFGFVCDRNRGIASGLATKRPRPRIRRRFILEVPQVSRATEIYFA